MPVAAFAAPLLPGLSPPQSRAQVSPASRRTHLPQPLPQPRRRTRVVTQPHDRNLQPDTYSRAGVRQAASAVAHVQQQQQTRPARLAVLASGGGRSLANLLAAIAEHRLTDCEVAVVVASKASAGALDHAEHYSVPSRVAKRKDYADAENVDLAFSNAVARVLDEFEVDLVVMAGWMHFFHIPDRYLGRVINIHPSLIPAFSGKGYYGSRVHDAVVKAGVKVTGCTVHLADNIYDHGPIILQRPVTVQAHDTAEDVASRVFEQELIALPDAVQLFVHGRLDLRGNIVHILPAAVGTTAAPLSAELDVEAT